MFGDKSPYVVRTGTFVGTEYIPGHVGMPVNWTNNSFMQVTFITQGSNGEIGECRIEEEPPYTTNYVAGQTAVQVFQADSSGLPTGNAIFSGVIVKTLDILQEGYSHLEHVAYNLADDHLRRMIIQGQYVLTNSAGNDYFNNGVISSINVPFDDFPTIINWTQKPIVFNPKGEYNCCAQPYNDNNGDFWVFDFPSRKQVNITGGIIKSIPWTVVRIIQYIRKFYGLHWSIDATSWDDSVLFDIFGDYGTPESPSTIDYNLINFNVQGRTLQNVLRELLEPYGLGFTISPWLNNNGLHEIFFFTKNAITDVAGTVILSPITADTISVDVGTPNCIGYDITEDSTPCITTVNVSGNDIVHTTLAATNFNNWLHDGPGAVLPGFLPLIPGWNSSFLPWADIKPDGVSVNSSKPLYTQLNNLIGGDNAYGVGRVWLVNSGENNENVDYSLADLTARFADADNEVFSNSPRKLEDPKCYSTNSNGSLLQQQNLQVEISFDGGTVWNVVDSDKYEVLKDSTGIVFTEPNLDDMAVNNNSNSGVIMSYWDSLRQSVTGGNISNMLELRIVCSFKSDAKAGGSASISPDPQLATLRNYEDLGFDYYKQNNVDQINPVAAVSLLYSSGVAIDTVDDRPKANAVATRLLNNTGLPVYSGRIVLFCPPESALDMFWNFEPGLVVTAILNRRDFSDNPPVIVKTLLDCVNRNMQIHLIYETGSAIGFKSDPEKMKNMKLQNPIAKQILMDAPQANNFSPQALQNLANVNPGARP